MINVIPFPDTKLSLVKFKDELTQGEEMSQYYGQYDGRTYVYLGEFPHAPGHVLLMEFGSWKVSGMHEIDNLEMIERHPDDFTITLDDDDE